MKTNREEQIILQHAMQLINAKGVQVGPLTQFKIDSRITIMLQPSCLKSANPHSLTITRHRDQNVVVLQAIWRDVDDEPFIATFLPGAWKHIVARAVKMLPQNILP